MRQIAVLIIALSFSAQMVAVPRADAAQAPQPPASGQALTLAQAVQETFAHNPQVAAAQQTLESARQSVLAARAGYGLTISVDGSGGLGTTAAAGSFNAAPLAKPTGTGSLSFDASVPVYDGGKTKVAVEQAAAQVASAQAALRQTEQDLELAAGTQFFTVLKNEALANVQQQVLAQAQVQLAATQAQVKAGVAPQADVIQAQAQVAQAEVSLLNARAQILTAKAALASTIGTDTTAPIEVANPAAPPARVTATSAAVIAAAVRDRPEIAKAQAAVQSSQAQLDTAYANAGPQIDVNVGAGYTPVGTSPAVNNTTSYGLTGTISLPLFDSGKGKAEVAGARAGLKSAQAQLDAARVSVRQDAYQAYLNAVQAAANVTATEAARAAADEAFRVAQGRYRAGVGTIVEVITAQTQATQADVNATAAVYDFQSALLTLQHAQGAPIATNVGEGKS